MKIGDKIRSIREAKNMTASQLAENAAISQSTISQIENGYRNPSTATLIRIASALKVNINVLMSDGKSSGRELEPNTDSNEITSIFEFDEKGFRLGKRRDFKIKSKSRDIIVSITMENKKSEIDDEESNASNFMQNFDETIARDVIFSLLSEHRKEIVKRINIARKEELSAFMKGLERIKNKIETDDTES